MVNRYYNININITIVHISNNPFSASICAVFLDTSAKIANFSPPAAIDSSRRDFERNKLAPPFYLFPTFDLFKDHGWQALGR